MLRKFALPIIVLLGALLITSWLIVQRPVPAQKRPDPPVLLVDAIVAELASVRLKVHALGSVTPRTETSLTGEVAGQIVEVFPQFVSGGFFKRGDVLVKIDDRTYRAEVKRSQAAVAAAETLITREQGLSDYALQDWHRLNPDKEATDLALRKPQLAEARANLQSALADLERKEGDLERTVVRAPYDGMIRQKLADVGQFVGAGTQLAVIFASDVAEIRLPLPDKDLPFVDLKAQPPVEVTANIGGTDYYWRGKIVRTEGVFDQQSRVLYVVAQVADPYNQDGESWAYPLRIGTFVGANIEGRRADNLVVLPRSALRRDNRVWTIDSNNLLVPKTVSVLRTDASSVYINSGLEDNELVCLTLLENPLPGTVVRHVEAEQNQP
ncbi:MAG: efflux RND transporter periplasmic adaptor subunit [Proteobacteria bacterium]|jgi:membrane fusion protein, multidrug efflux system|nr:efflux RND transporter periplasmic adaptor subunit [Pseudomonadota bacterium]MBT6348315.1 efflux RND transporter periplasmic adaptor subunit [Pseudomonadota bacterium]